jgi:hypothetical protein
MTDHDRPAAHRTSDDPRKARLGFAAAELALVEIDIWKLAAAARILLGTVDDPDFQRVAREIQALEDRKVCATAEVWELAAELDAGSRD